VGRGWVQDAILKVGRSTMRNPLDSYGPEPEGDGSMGPGGPDPSRWLQWVQLGLTSALLVLFINQVIESRAINRKIARLHERIDLIDNTRILDVTPALEAQQRTIQERLRQLETAMRELAADNQPPTAAEGEIPAFQLPQPPRIMR